MRLVIAAALAFAMGTRAFCDQRDINLFLDGGRLALRNVSFIRIFGSSRVYTPELRFVVVNQTNSFWNRLELEFDIQGSCGGEPRRWSIPVQMYLGYSATAELATEHVETPISLISDWTASIGGAIFALLPIGLAAIISGLHRIECLLAGAESRLP